MDEALARWCARRVLGTPDLQAFTPEQEEARTKIANAQENLANIRQQIAEAVKTSGGQLSPDPVEAVLQQHPEWCADLANAHGTHDNAMRKAVRAGLDTYPYRLAKCAQPLPHDAAKCATCIRNAAIHTLARAGLIGYPLELREWIITGLVLRRRKRPFRALRDVRPDLERGMREQPISKHYIALAEAVSLHLRQRKTWGEIFNATLALREQSELEARAKGEKAPKHGSPWALQKWAKKYLPPELLDMELKLEQLQPMGEQSAAADATLEEGLALGVVEKLATQGAPLQEALEQLHPVLQEKKGPKSILKRRRRRECSMESQRQQDLWAIVIENYQAAALTAQHNWHNVSVACSYYAVFTAMWVALGDPSKGHWEHRGIVKPFAAGQWRNPPTSVERDIIRSIRSLYTDRLEADYEAIRFTSIESAMSLTTARQVLPLVADALGLSLEGITA